MLASSQKQDCGTTVMRLRRICPFTENGTFGKAFDTSVPRMVNFDMPRSLAAGAAQVGHKCFISVRRVPCEAMRQKPAKIAGGLYASHTAGRPAGQGRQLKNGPTLRESLVTRVGHESAHMSRGNGHHP